MRLSSIAIVTSLLAASSASAAIINFDLLGKAGAGLLGGNEVHELSLPGGSGGEVGAGIFFDTTTRILTINIAWGSAAGFTDLTGNATAGHIHGPTDNGGVLSFNQTKGVRYGLDNLVGWNPSATAGGFSGSLIIAEGDVQALFDGRFYINVHTGRNSPGEIRGNIVIPTPASAALLGVGALALRRRRR